MRRYFIFFCSILTILNLTSHPQQSHKNCFSGKVFAKFLEANYGQYGLYNDSSLYKFTKEIGYNYRYKKSEIIDNLFQTICTIINNYDNITPLVTKTSSNYEKNMSLLALILADDKDEYGLLKGLFTENNIEIKTVDPWEQVVKNINELSKDNKINLHNETLERLQGLELLEICLNLYVGDHHTSINKAGAWPLTRFLPLKRSSIAYSIPKTQRILDKTLLEIVSDRRKKKDIQKEEAKIIDKNYFQLCKNIRDLFFCNGIYNPTTLTKLALIGNSINIETLLKELKENGNSAILEAVLLELESEQNFNKNSPNSKYKPSELDLRGIVNQIFFNDTPTTVRTQVNPYEAVIIPAGRGVVEGFVDFSTPERLQNFIRKGMKNSNKRTQQSMIGLTSILSLTFVAIASGQIVCKTVSSIGRFLYNKAFNRKKKPVKRALPQEPITEERSAKKRKFSSD